MNNGNENGESHQELQQLQLLKRDPTEHHGSDEDTFEVARAKGRLRRGLTTGQPEKIVTHSHARVQSSSSQHCQ
ncbi:UNVERIFIED_CONTAM: hypothetical protein Sradi_3628700 [Sesamum radiatum]|uniref:Uncharacterized protein n=1 Tax=Sesamum radiatum TaxID=300843 RepID=A0AAW2QHK8_SESRA